MKSKDPDKFEIRFDDTAPEPIDPEDMQEHRLDRLRLRITLVAILIPCLLGLLLLAGYFDLKRRMTAVDTTGSTEVKKVSKTLESSFSSVSVQVAKLEENVNKRLDAMQKSLGTQAQRLEKLEKELGRLDRAKADDKALSSAVEKEKTARSAADDKIASTIAELAATRKEQDLKIAAASADLVKTATRIDSMQTELRALEAEVETLAELRTDLKVLDLARKEDRDSLEKKLSSLAGDLRQRIEELSRKLSELSRKPAAQSGEPAAKPAPSAAKPTAQPPQPPAPTDSGSILEQDLK